VIGIKIKPHTIHVIGLHGDMCPGSCDKTADISQVLQHSSSVDFCVPHSNGTSNPDTNNIFLCLRLFIQHFHFLPFFKKHHQWSLHSFVGIQLGCACLLEIYADKHHVSVLNPYLFLTKMEIHVARTPLKIAKIVIFLCYLKSGLMTYNF